MSCVRVAALEERRELVAVVGEDLLGHAEPEHVAEEVGRGVDVLAHEEHVVDAWRRHADQALGADRRVELRHPVADLHLAVLELDHVTGRGPEAHDRRRSRRRACPARAGWWRCRRPRSARCSVSRSAACSTLNADGVEAVGGAAAEDQRVVLVLVPPLQVRRARRARRRSARPRRVRRPRCSTRRASSRSGTRTSTCDSRRMPAHVYTVRKRPLSLPS